MPPKTSQDLWANQTRLLLMCFMQILTPSAFERAENFSTQRKAKQHSSSRNAHHFRQSNNNYTRIVMQRRKKLKLCSRPEHKKLIVCKSGLAAAATAAERRMQNARAARLNFSPRAAAAVGAHLLPCCWLLIIVL